MTVTDLSADVTKPALLPIGQTFGGAALFPPRKKQSRRPSWGYSCIPQPLCFFTIPFCRRPCQWKKGKTFMLKNEFWYDLPKELIAQEPCSPRDAARLFRHAPYSLYNLRCLHLGSHIPQGFLQERLSSIRHPCAALRPYFPPRKLRHRPDCGKYRIPLFCKA